MYAAVAAAPATTIPIMGKKYIQVLRITKAPGSIISWRVLKKK